MLTDVAGVRVGHWTDEPAATGCTVVLLPEGTVASGEVRGGAPAEREMALLDPGRLVENVDAVVLTGGSAFGLAAADGVVEWCEGQGLGFPTPAGKVPIVVAMAVFDLAVGSSSVRPGRAEGLAAANAASPGSFDTGRVGVGTGCTTDKWTGAEPLAGGVVTATLRNGDLVVSALVAVNAAGSVGADGPVPAGSEAHSGPSIGPNPFGNTTVGVVVTNADLTKLECFTVSQSAHDGLARSVFPTHTAFDGDAFVAAATGQVEADVHVVRPLAVAVVESAIRSLVDLR